MLKLLLLRHAKSSWADPGKSDFDRPLNGRGREAAPAMGAFMAANGLAPQRVFCSSAQRARETLAMMLPHIATDMEVTLTRRLYEADCEGYLTAARTVGGTVNTVLLIGHNPAMEDVAMVLAPTGDPDSLMLLREKFPTCGLAVIEFDGPRWDETGPGGGRLVAFHTPRSIGAED
jgi:phosphohistidine phosphatase